MVGELSNSHSYVSGGDLKLPKKPNVGLLGARFELDKAAGRYRIASIMAGENDEERYRSPLTEVGINVHAGDYILAVNGQELRANDNPYRLLQIASGQPVELRVGAKADGNGARSVLVKPIASETDLKYYAWVEHNRRYVEEKSGGKLGYVYIPDMGGDGIREFIKWFYPQIRKQGLVVDARDNGGGNVSEMIIERLGRKVLGVNYTRNSTATGTYPQQAFYGYMAALISESTASDGDIFAYMFKKAQLGPTIGKRTWGGVVGISDYGPVIDGGSVEVPEFVAIADLQGNYHVEGEGVSPDIEVDNDVFSTIHGKDPQLDRAIAEDHEEGPGESARAAAASGRSGQGAGRHAAVGWALAHRLCAFCFICCARKKRWAKAHPTRGAVRWNRREIRRAARDPASERTAGPQGTAPAEVRASVARFSSTRPISGSTRLPTQPASRQPSATIARALSSAWLRQPRRRPTTRITGSFSARTRSACIKVGDNGTAQPPTPSTTRQFSFVDNAAKAARIGSRRISTPAARAARCGAIASVSAYGLTSM